uniref:Amidase domain-containing protein n=1 Tax=Chromera velia CCMP2878 TaxID=1169474 RepID=A0A0G4GNN5_9ALVE|eukprot:Cvel_22694.t1-p1 / transcript=Cvel_22694.t1 / gene=Cvel_22694 / organism=Chromera_velia_CCMP2878 / gene_product=Indoleacetamide hydrolase, putative / transcript_product=Indoleacetamide hydrolase, putative / location=Cvel_scaffold2260:14903-16363(+) / protein_length=487 / sequence_SO=supercontig / SO=protein_coding / is_pseudo=false
MKSLSSLLNSLQRRQTTCVQIAEEVLLKAEQFKAYNHFTFLNGAALLNAAKLADKAWAVGEARALEGIPFGVKDNINTGDGTPTTGASPAYLSNIPKTSCALWSILSGAGALNAGKLNMHELAFGTTSINAHYGACASAADITRTAGGSSGGSGGVVGTGVVPVSLGTDTGGSIRIPAASNGVTGYRPSVGTWPQNYGLKMTHSRDSPGPLANCMEDILLLHEIVTGEKRPSPVSPKDVRLFVVRDYFFDDLCEETDSTMETAIGRLADAGFNVIDGKGQGVEEFPSNVPELISASSFPVMDYELPLLIEEYAKAHALDADEYSFAAVTKRMGSPDVRQICDRIAAHPVSPEAYAKAVASRDFLRSSVKGFMERNAIDALVFPTVPFVPHRIDDCRLEGDSPIQTITHRGRRVPQLTSSIRNTDLASNLDSPAVSLPCRRRGVPGDGSVTLPVGLELCGRPGSGRDSRLLAVAEAAERALGVAKRLD